VVGSGDMVKREREGERVEERKKTHSVESKRLKVSDQQRFSSESDPESEVVVVSEPRAKEGKKQEGGKESARVSSSSRRRSQGSRNETSHSLVPSRSHPSRRTVEVVPSSASSSREYPSPEETTSEIDGSSRSDDAVRGSSQDSSCSSDGGDSESS